MRPRESWLASNDTADPGSVISPKSLLVATEGHDMPSSTQRLFEGRLIRQEAIRLNSQTERPATPHRALPVLLMHPVGLGCGNGLCQNDCRGRKGVGLRVLALSAYEALQGVYGARNGLRREGR
jgi:hypothetical protein